jgi:hypothetical protein
MDCSYRADRQKPFCSLGEISDLPESKSAFPGGAAHIAEIIQSNKGPPLYILDGEVRLKPTEFVVWLAEFLAVEEARRGAAALRKRLPKRPPAAYAETDIFADLPPPVKPDSDVACAETDAVAADSTPAAPHADVAYAEDSNAAYSTQLAANSDVDDELELAS